MSEHKRFTLIVAAVAITSIFVSKANAVWQAKWIGPGEPQSQNTWLCFRKQFDLSAKPNSMAVKIACDSKYWLWINGDLVVFEGQLKRGPTPQDTYYDKVEIGERLNKGENTVAVLVWYWGRHGFSHNSSGKAGLIFESTDSDIRILSDKTWKVTRHPSYGPTEGPHPNFRLPEFNILYDARKAPGPWTQPEYDDSRWQDAVEYGTPPTAPWNNLVQRPIPLWKDSGLMDYENKLHIPETAYGEEIVCTLPANIHITPYLKIDAPAGRRIDIMTDNYRGGGSPNVRAVYITKKGVQEYESPGWMNGHDVRYRIPEGIRILDLKYRETGYNAEFVGELKCDDEDLNTLWQKAKRTLYVTMRDTYMDCPDRERAQWWGDAANELGEAFYVFDYERGPLLAKKGIYELALWHKDDGSLYSPVPSGRPASDMTEPDEKEGYWYKELPRQMLTSIGWYGFWTYYMYTGDKQTIAEVYPAVRNYLRLWRIGDNGLVVHRTGDWDWTDWGSNKDVPVIENAWLYLALKAAVEMARLSGNSDDIAQYTAKMESIESNFNKTFWRADKYRSPGYAGETDDRANAMAVVAGLAKDEYYPAIAEVLARQYHASPYMEKYVLEALYLMDRPGQAVARAKRRWADQIESELTTLWEGWGIGKEGYGGGTYNHAWSGGALTVLSQYAAGVAPIEPGYQSYAVIPQMSPLKSIDAVIPTPRGNIHLSLRDKSTAFEIELDSPEGSAALLAIPGTTESFKSMTANGRTLLENGKTVSRARGIRFVGSEDNRTRFELAPGTWRIKAAK